MKNPVTLVGGPHDGTIVDMPDETDSLSCPWPEGSEKTGGAIYRPDTTDPKRWAFQEES